MVFFLLLIGCVNWLKWDSEKILRIYSYLFCFFLSFTSSTYFAQKPLFADLIFCMYVCMCEIRNSLEYVWDISVLAMLINNSHHLCGSTTEAAVNKKWNCLNVFVRLFSVFFFFWIYKYVAITFFLTCKWIFFFFKCYFLFFENFPKPQIIWYSIEWHNFLLIIWHCLIYFLCEKTEKKIHVCSVITPFTQEKRHTLLWRKQQKKIVVKLRF